MAPYLYIYTYTTHFLYTVQNIFRQRGINIYIHTHTYIQLFTYASSARVSSRTEHAEMHNGGRHKIDMYNSIKPLKKKGRNLTIISHFQSIHVTQRTEQIVGINGKLQQYYL